MMQIRSTLAALVIVSSFAPAPAPAAGGRLTLTGAASGAVDVTLAEPAMIRVIGNATLSDATIGGSFAGFAVQRDTGEGILIGAVRVPALESTGTAEFPWPFVPRYSSVAMPFTPKRYSERAELSPGTYRFTLLADGPTTIHIDLTGSGEVLSAAVVEPADVEAELFDLGPVPGNGPGVGIAERPLQLGPSTFTVVAAVTTAVAGQASFAAACLTGSSPTDICEGEGFAFGSPGSVHTRNLSDRAYLPGVVSAAAPIAKFRTLMGGYSTVRKGFWLTWEIG